MAFLSQLDLGLGCRCMIFLFVFDPLDVNHLVPLRVLGLVAILLLLRLRLLDHLFTPATLLLSLEWLECGISEAWPKQAFIFKTTNVSSNTNCYLKKGPSMNLETGSSLFSSARALVRLLLAKKSPKKGSFLWPVAR